MQKIKGKMQNPSSTMAMVVETHRAILKSLKMKSVSDARITLHIHAAHSRQVL